MFDIKLIEKFRFSVTQESEIEEDVKEAWFIFHNEFVRNVSYHWRHYLKTIRKGGTYSFHGIMTASDEAYTLWLLKNKYSEAEKEAKEIQQQGRELWMKNKSKRIPATHDSKWKLDDFIDLHFSIKKQRAVGESNAIWESIFFSQFFNSSNNDQGLKDPDSSSKRCLNEANLLDDEDEIIHTVEEL
jgi:hypothetical protein